MAFARTETTILNHPKFAGLDPAAIGLWTLGNAYCWDQLTDGFIPAAQVYRLLSWVRRARVTVLANVLVNATAGGRYRLGLWERVADGFQVHDWLATNPSRAEILATRQAAQVRMRQYRADKRASERASERAPVRPTKFPERSPGDVDVDVQDTANPLPPSRSRQRSSPRSVASTLAAAPPSRDPAIIPPAQVEALAQQLASDHPEWSAHTVTTEAHRRLAADEPPPPAGAHVNGQPTEPDPPSHPAPARRFRDA